MYIHDSLPLLRGPVLIGLAKINFFFFILSARRGFWTANLPGMLRLLCMLQCILLSLRDDNSWKVSCRSLTVMVGHLVICLFNIFWKLWPFRPPRTLFPGGNGTILKLLQILDDPNDSGLVLSQITSNFIGAESLNMLDQYACFIFSFKLSETFSLACGGFLKEQQNDFFLLALWRFSGNSSD